MLFLNVVRSHSLTQAGVFVSDLPGGGLGWSSLLGWGGGYSP